MGAKVLCLAADPLQELSPADFIRHTRVVGDLAGHAQGTGPEALVQDQCFQIGAGRVDRRRGAGRPPTDDDRVIDIVLILLSLSRTKEQLHIQYDPSSF